MKSLIIVLGIMIFIVLIYLLEGLLFWGLGNLIIFLFGLNFKWTYFHGLGLAIIELIIGLVLWRNK